MRKNDSVIRRWLPEIATLVFISLVGTPCLAAEPSIECPKIKAAKKAASRFIKGAYDEMSELLVSADSDYEGRALYCFFQIVSKKKVSQKSYHRLGLALFELGKKRPDLEGELALTYLWGSELALRRAYHGSWEASDADTMQLRLHLAHVLLEQVRGHGQRHLTREVVDLLEAVLKLGPGSETADRLREIIRIVSDLGKEGDAGSGCGSKAFRAAGAYKWAKRLASPHPGYTPEALTARVQGTVFVRALIDSSGNVSDVEILKGLPMGLSSRAAEAVKTWRFEPATSAGEPVPVCQNLVVLFSLGEFGLPLS